MSEDNFWDNHMNEWFSEFGEESLEETVPSLMLKPHSTEARMTLLLIFLIDVSGSMRGVRIAQVNYALENIFKELRRKDNLEAKFKVAILEFSNEAVWKTEEPQLLDDYAFVPIVASPSYTCYGKAFRALERKLHSNAFMDPENGEYFAPLILFISDGEPMDKLEYQKALKELNENVWFKKASKYAIAVGKEAKTRLIGEILSEFAGARENVRYADEGTGLCSLIEYVAVRASEAQTSMATSDPDLNGRESMVFSSVDSALFSDNGAQPDDIDE